MITSLTWGGLLTTRMHFAWWFALSTFDSSQKAMSRWKLRFLDIYGFFSFLEGYYFAFANIFVMSVLKSYTVVMRQIHF